MSCTKRKRINSFVILLYFIRRVTKYPHRSKTAQLKSFSNIFAFFMLAELLVFAWFANSSQSVFTSDLSALSLIAGRDGDSLDRKPELDRAEGIITYLGINSYEWLLCATKSSKISSSLCTTLASDNYSWLSLITWAHLLLPVTLYGTQRQFLLNSAAKTCQN